MQKAISFFLINTNIDKNAPLLELILNCGYDSKNTRERGEFIHELVDDIFYTLDRNLGNDSNTLISNFWQIWERLFDKIAEHKTSRFSSQFLLAGRYWKETAEHWIPLETGHSFFEKKIPLLEKFNVNDLISLLTGLGFKTLSPSGIIWVMNKIRENPADAANLNFRLSEKFAEKNFRSNAREIKHKKKLLEDYISFLNILVDLGSSKAYLIRENMLLYKANRNMLACR